MSRTQTLLTKAVLIAGIISLSLVLQSDVALAQCAHADQCSPQDCTLRQASVHPTCDQPRSCTTINVDNKVELFRRLTINQQCLTARLDVSQCFSNSDPGHDVAIQSVRNAIATCQTKFYQ